MSKSRIMVLGLAIGSAALAAYLANGFLGQPQQETAVVQKAPTVDVLVSRKTLQMGEKLVGGAVDWQAWPESAVTPSMITKTTKPDAVTEYEQARARMEIFEGEPVNERKLVLPSDNGFMAAILPKGYRGIAVRISEATGAGGFILPNDRVDVIMTRKLEDGGRAVVSETVLTNVRVLAINRSFKQSSEAGDETVAEKMETATLELNPQQSEVIAMTETMGQLALALRSIAESGDKGLADAEPQLSEKYAKGSAGADFTIVKYGVAKTVSNR
jgi:pilus assembly protein CpaB